MHSLCMRLCRLNCEKGMEPCTAADLSCDVQFHCYPRDGSRQVFLPLSEAVRRHWNSIQIWCNFFFYFLKQWSRSPLMMICVCGMSGVSRSLARCLKPLMGSLSVQYRLPKRLSSQTSKPRTKDKTERGGAPLQSALQHSSGVLFLYVVFFFCRNVLPFCQQSEFISI